MTQLEELLQNATDIERQLGYQFKDKELLALAFVHRSFVNENRDVLSHNERLEFLGDSVLGLLIAEYLYTRFPDTPEGELSYLRSRLVEAGSCVAYVQKLKVSSHLLLGKGEKMNDGRGRETILADLFEALIGAIYLDGGLSAAESFLKDNFKSEIEETLATPLHNWKALLQDYCQKKFQVTPTYRVLEAAGPDHSKTFTVAVCIKEKILGKGSGPSKKEAQQSAAASAMSQIEKIDKTDSLSEG